MARPALKHASDGAMRVLVVSFVFPPFNNVGGVRTGKTAKYLTQFGHDVRVIAAAEQDARPRSLAVEIPLDRVTYAPWFNPRRPLERVFGRGRVGPWGDGGDAPAPTARRRAFEAGLRFVRAAYFPEHFIGWLPFALAAGSRLVARWRPDVIFASSGPVTSLITGHLLSRRTGVPWVGELRDLWTDFHYYRHPAWRRRVEARLERRVLSSAAALVTVSEPLADTLRARFQRPTAVVLNGFDPADYSGPRAGATGREGLRIVYTGTVYPGRQTPAPLFEALARLGPLAAGMRVAFFGAARGLVSGVAKAHGVEQLVEVNEPLPHREALRAQCEADILLHLLWTDREQRGVYNAKIFEYLGARRPILAVGYTENVSAELVRARGAGAALDDPEAIARQLGTWIEEKRRLGSIPALDPAVSAGLSREEQARVLETFLRQVV